MRKAGTDRRRATVLIMVVSLLALLFVIVTGFINVARVDRELQIEVRSGDASDRVTNAVVDRLIDLVGSQLVTEQGSALAGGDARTYSNEDIPGYRHTHWLASNEPVWNAAWNAPGMQRLLGPQPVGDWARLEQIWWPSVTGVSGGSASRPTRYSISRLIPEDDDDTNMFLAASEIIRAARKPMLDATGDGVPDTAFLAVAPLIEMANTMAGTPVQLSGSTLDINAIPSVNTNDSTELEQRAVWQAYRENARYSVAARVVSHGGMVALDAAPVNVNGFEFPPVNRSFTTSLFHSIRHPNENTSRFLLSTYQGGGEDGLYRDLLASRSSVESSLRRRGGLLAGPEALDSSTNRWYRNVPSVLSWLQGEPRTGQAYSASGLRQTFIPQFESQRRNYAFPGAEPWQRFNIGDEGPNPANSDRSEWAFAAALNPVDYNAGGAARAAALRRYARRQALTTVSYSDDIARKQQSGDPVKSLLDPTGVDLKTYEGELKFYLGEIAKAYRATGSFGLVYDHLRGMVIIEQLARLYYDMLESHSRTIQNTANANWGGVFSTDQTDSDDPDEVVSRRQQAFMLAVNTVAFAAPRQPMSTGGNWIDVVSYTDRAGGVGVEYVGYAPQPFFSEIIADDAYDAGDDEDNPRDPNDPTGPGLAIAVELYNPQDPFLSGGQDIFALYLPQFAISVGGAANPNQDVEGSTWQTLGSALHGFDPANTAFPGRNFLSFALKGSQANTTFDAAVGNRIVPVNLPLGDSSANNRKITLKLWRQGRYYDSNSNTAHERWFVVDTIDVEMPDRAEEFPNQGGWTSRWRDLSVAMDRNLAPLYNVVTTPPLYARWSMATAWDDDRTIASDGSGDVDDWTNASRGSGSPDTLVSISSQPEAHLAGGAAVAPQASMPLTPLITMNAGPASGPTLYEQLTNLPMFGNAWDLRPRSFPTVGFLLFVPRYSHVQQVTPAEFPLQQPILATRAMSQTLEKHRRRKHSGAGDTWSYAADLAHMPVFDNRTEIGGADKYLNQAGKIPWGLLVFDYFTTMRPERAGVDPLRIPGRININNAPWYLLAQIPVMGPQASGAPPILGGYSSGPTPSWPSPSFWSPDSGVLAGVSEIGRGRLLANDSLAFTDHAPTNTNSAELAAGLRRLGPWLAQSAAAYRDGIQYLPLANLNLGWTVFADSHLRGGPGDVWTGDGVVGIATSYRPGIYGTGATNGIRGATTMLANGVINSNDYPSRTGFLTIGELLNVKGFDSSVTAELPPSSGATDFTTTLGRGDFVKAVSLLALIDSQYLTTRSNTFTVYASIMDRENPQASVRAQATIDRSNLLPRLEYHYNWGSGNPDSALNPRMPVIYQASGGAIRPVRTVNSTGRPEIIAQQRVGYFNARLDD